ncbi:MaoC family dehydratase N-terminal domain-containing protein [Rhodoplanes sp. TEM]|uniref:MaoC family dehydratase N-terminal domain-containing protein n=1 Tax=Rhodoplanes tepidamans TaxID=200616 RepID=A0ABT5JK00_RHOTP|nr:MULTISPECIES: MaoC family dehydratase N-terminal domain-containing protein [Rhodoplanes]MDC7790030.1 MaoC family dehydratase N-terminal domain-containing protein [Rhodoplanes tepidamans]MDC7987417.1 MaoC family dehydratase N-terminal domain-containing protein [Rhodoplanes sp. TEM]MDQ0357735.1 3-methylfumaryl-CoA hydratase [Rhodoplanes tepidamans]
MSDVEADGAKANGASAEGTKADEANLQDWVGRTEEASDQAYPTPARALAATLDQAGVDAGVGKPLPELWHWLYFLPIVPAGEIGPDGHPKRGGFLPPIALERRMWASGRYVFHDRVRVGDVLHKTSKITRIAEKQGNTGRMVFVTVKHTVRSGRGPAVEEEQDIVYLPMPAAFTPPPPTPAPENPAWSEPVALDPVLLFRFSALTFNGHRIHYDLPYARETEKYPGLVLHGPLQALLLLEAARRHAPDRMPARYTFRAVYPLFGHDRLTLMGVARPDGGHDLFTVNGDGHVGMQATVAWAANER